MFADAGTVGSRSDVTDRVVRGLGAVLAVATAAIHVSVGDQILVLNAAGAVVLAGALVAPLGAVLGTARGRLAGLFVQLALAGYAAATIVGWIAMGDRDIQGYAATTIELAIIGLMLANVARVAGAVRSPRFAN